MTNPKEIKIAFYTKDDEPLRLDVFIKTLKGLQKALRATDRIVSGKKKPTVKFLITDLKLD